MIVVDASVALAYLFAGSTKLGIREALFSRSPSWHAPHVIDLEVVHATRRVVARREMSAERGRQAIADWADLPLRRYPHDRLLPRIWELRDNLTAYDAAYVALAEVLDATLITGDARLAAAPGHNARIEWLSTRVDGP